MTRYAWCVLFLAGCSCGDDEGECKNSGECSDRLACVDHECVECADDADCGSGAVCDEAPDGSLGCYDPVVVRGRVFDLESGAGIEGARVVALDANASPASDVAVTDADGNYELPVPSLRNEEGGPVGAQITLRADAQGYQTFPGGVRQALPIDTTSAAVTGAEDDRDLVVQSALTEIGLVAIPDAGDASIHGTVALAEDSPFGVLVVAEIDGVGTSGIADDDGDYAIFNLAPGSYTVDGYTRGAAYEQATVDLTAGADAEVNLGLSDAETGTMNGSVSIVNPGDGDGTSVILVVESTFDETTGRGDAPPGFRFPEPGTPPTLTNEFSIDGIPAGSYVVLAAFENDFLVRDPDICISGTDTLHQDVAAGEVVDAGAFKVTGSLDVISPGADGPQGVTGTPTFTWVDDSSEENYDVVVFDTFGQIVWETTIPGESGDDPVVTYGGPPLEVGMFYQFRATSTSTSGGGGETCNKSRTEDLKGVFFIEGA